MLLNNDNQNVFLLQHVRTDAARVVVKFLRVTQEEVDEQEDE